jgi:uncharacterized protein YdeI (YjbR/CyaY-like superfamily)
MNCGLASGDRTMTAGMEKTLFFSNPGEWRAWLEEHYATEREAWLVHYKKKFTGETLTYEQAVEEALCFGWIDGLLHKIDDEKFALRYSPRRPRSVWSVANQERVEKLIHEGRMTAAGLEKIHAAKANGEWDAATAREDINAIPADLAEELEKDQAWAAFDEWPPSRKKGYLYWLGNAKRAETRQKRIREIVEMALTGRD